MTAVTKDRQAGSRDSVPVRHWNSSSSPTIQPMSQAAGPTETSSPVRTTARPAPGGGRPVRWLPRVPAVTVDDGGDEGPPGRIARLGAGTPLELQQFSDDPADVPGGRTHRDVLTGQDFRTAGLR